jgi:rRNA maturation endonuclease Nob1
MGTTGSQVNGCYTTTTSSFSSLATSNANTEFTNNIALGKKSLETGRVEKGSDSNQELQTDNYKFNTFSFHKIEYKLLPASLKVSTVEEITIKKYCVNCGTKVKSEHKFCAQCGTKI